MASASPPVHRDIIAVGSSAGGIEALMRLVAQLPARLPASMVIVQHLANTENPLLVELLVRRSPLPVRWVEQGAALEHGTIYVAPPDTHVLFTNDHLRLSRAPRENHARPSIDKLFRSAAVIHSTRVVGVLLTGMLHDGVRGLRAIQQAGGFTIVQDPADAEFAELPTRAVEAFTPDRVVPLDQIGAVLRTAIGPAGVGAAPPPAVLVEASLDLVAFAEPGQIAQLGPQVAVACPDCHGPMWTFDEEPERRFRCELGHVTTARDILERGSVEVEAALWSAIRALTDRAHTLEVLGVEAATRDNPHSARSYADRSREARGQAHLLRELMLELTRVR